MGGGNPEFLELNLGIPGGCAVEPAGGDQESASRLGGVGSASIAIGYLSIQNALCMEYLLTFTIIYPTNQPNVVIYHRWILCSSLSMNVFLAVRAEGRQSYAFIESSWRCNYFKRMLLRHLEVIFYGFYYDGKSPSFASIWDNIFGAFSLSISNPSSPKADIKKIYLKHPWDWYIYLDLP